MGTSKNTQGWFGGARVPEHDAAVVLRVVEGVQTELVRHHVRAPALLVDPLRAPPGNLDGSVVVGRAAQEGDRAGGPAVAVGRAVAASRVHPEVRGEAALARRVEGVVDHVQPGVDRGPAAKRPAGEADAAAVDGGGLPQSRQAAVGVVGERGHRHRALRAVG